MIPIVASWVLLRFTRTAWVELAPLGNILQFDSRLTPDSPPVVIGRISAAQPRTMRPMGTRITAKATWRKLAARNNKTGLVAAQK